MKPSNGTTITDRQLKRFIFAVPNSQSTWLLILFQTSWTFCLCDRGIDPPKIGIRRLHKTGQTLHYHCVTLIQRLVQAFLWVALMQYLGLFCSEFPTFGWLVMFLVFRIDNIPHAFSALPTLNHEYFHYFISRMIFCQNPTQPQLNTQLDTKMTLQTIPPPTETLC